MNAPEDIQQLHEFASRPGLGVQESLRSLDGNVLVLGAGGKMGFHLSATIHRALKEIESPARIRAVSRFGSPDSKKWFNEYGIETISADLTDESALQNLPDSTNVFFLAGVKFGTANNPEWLQQMNINVPRAVTRRFAGAKFVALSTGCVYPFVASESGGSVETDLPPTTLCETNSDASTYAESCRGREQAFIESNVKVSLIRLNYSVDLRYGVLVDLAVKIQNEQPIDLTTGHVNVIWQGDANQHIVQALKHASQPAFILNVTGKQTLRIRDVATRLGELLDKPVNFSGEEAPLAWLNNSEKAISMFGEPSVPEETLMEWVASWVGSGGELLNKPTHFEVRDGTY